MQKKQTNQKTHRNSKCDNVSQHANSNNEAALYKMISKNCTRYKNKIKTKTILVQYQLKKKIKRNNIELSIEWKKYASDMNWRDRDDNGDNDVDFNDNDENSYKKLFIINAPYAKRFARFSAYESQEELKNNTEKGKDEKALFRSNTWQILQSCGIVGDTLKITAILFEQTNRDVHRLNEEKALAGSDVILLRFKYLRNQPVTSHRGRLEKKIATN